MKKKVTLSLDDSILEEFRKSYSGSISSFIDGMLNEYNKNIRNKIENHTY